MDLAAWARGRLAATVVGITGSVGKTSTKDLVAAAVGAGRRVAANERSFNNEQGLPVTILGAPDDTEVLVLEMGMRGFGEIARLCAVGRPDIGVVTAVAAGAHRARRWHRRRRPGQGRARRGAAGRRARRSSTPTTSGSRRWPARDRGRRRDVRPRRRRRRAHRRPRARRRCARPAFTARTPWGERRRSRSPSAARTWRRTRRPRSPSPASSASTSTPPPTALGAAPSCRRCGWRCVTAVGRWRRDQRRLQRQPDVDGAPRSTRWPRSTPTGASPCSG